MKSQRKKLPASSEEKNSEFKRFSEILELLTPLTRYLKNVGEALTSWTWRNPEEVAEQIKGANPYGFLRDLLCGAFLASLFCLNLSSSRLVLRALREFDLPTLWTAIVLDHLHSALVSAACTTLLVAALAVLLGKIGASRSMVKDRDTVAAEMASLVLLEGSKSLFRIAFVSSVGGLAIVFVNTRTVQYTNLEVWIGLGAMFYLCILPALVIARVSRVLNWPSGSDTIASTLGGVLLFYIWLPLLALGTSAPWKRVHIAVSDFPRMSAFGPDRVQMAFRVSNIGFDSGVIFLGLGDHHKITFMPDVDRLRSTKASLASNALSFDLNRYEWIVDGKPAEQYVRINETAGVLLTLVFDRADLQFAAKSNHDPAEMRKTINGWPWLTIAFPLSVLDSELHGSDHVFLLNADLPDAQSMREFRTRELAGVNLRAP